MYVRKTSKAKSKRTYKKKSSSVSSKVKTYVNRAIKKNVELKTTLNTQALNQTMVTYNAPSSPPVMIDFSSALNISNGPAPGQRIGNQITMRSMPFRMIVRDPVGADGTTQIDAGFKFIIAKLKTGNQIPVAADFQALIQNGGSDEAPSNNYLDLISPLNKDLWSIKKTYSFKLSKLSTASTNLTPLSGHGLFKTISVDLAQYLPKTIKYSDGVSDPNNIGLYGFFLAGSTLGSSQAFISCKIDYNTWVKYSDE